jgi:hypothetical protein
LTLAISTAAAKISFFRNPIKPSFSSSDKKWVTTLGSRVARFFLTRYTKTGEIYQIATKLPNGRNKFRMAIEYSNLFHSEASQNLPKLGFLVWKCAIWQPCSEALEPTQMYVGKDEIQNG